MKKPILSPILSEFVYCKTDHAIYYIPIHREKDHDFPFTRLTIPQVLKYLRQNRDTIGREV